MSEISEEEMQALDDLLNLPEVPPHESDADMMEVDEASSLPPKQISDARNAISQAATSTKSQKGDLAATTSTKDDLAATQSKKGDLAATKSRKVSDGIADMDAVASTDADVQDQLNAIANAAKTKSKSTPRGAIASKATKSFGQIRVRAAKEVGKNLQEMKQSWKDAWASVQSGEMQLAGSHLQAAMKNGSWKLTRDLGSSGFSDSFEFDCAVDQSFAGPLSTNANIDLIKALDKRRSIPPPRTSTDWGTDDAIWNVLALFARAYKQCNTDFMLQYPMPLYTFMHVPLLKEKSGWLTSLRQRRVAGVATSITLVVNFQERHWVATHISSCKKHPDGCAAIIDPLCLYTEKDKIMKKMVQKLTDAGVVVKVANLKTQHDGYTCAWNACNFVQAANSRHSEAKTVDESLDVCAHDVAVPDAVLLQTHRGLWTRQPTCSAP